jgi:hypothetical protein
MSMAVKNRAPAPGAMSGFPPTLSDIGGCEYLAKPVKLEDLVACIEKHLGKT